MIWIFAKSYGVCIFLALIIGTMAGVFWTTIAPVAAEVVGLQELPAALSILWVVLAVPCTFAEPIGLKLRTTTGDEYLHSQIFTGCMYLAGALCLWILRVWKINDLEKKASSNGQVEESASQEGENPIQEHSLAHQTTSRRSKIKVLRGLWVWQRV